MEDVTVDSDTDRRDQGKEQDRSKEEGVES